MYNTKKPFALGFTIIELLIVIVIIGILATLIGVVYNGIQTRAHDTSVLSDIDTMDSLQTSYGLKEGVAGKEYYSGSGPDNELGFTASSGNVIDVVVDATDYCIRGYNLKGTKTTIYDAFTKESTLGTCDRLSASPGAIADSGTGGQAVVSTLAGSTYGYFNGNGSNAQFGSPTGVVTNQSGVVFVTDGSHTVRRITSGGDVSTFVGSPEDAGYVNGTGTAAKFAYMYGIDVDSSGNFYIGDSDNNRIRKVTPAGVVTTFAGSGVGGAANGTGVAAQFDSPRGIAVDSANNVYVADNHNCRVRKITPSAVVTTFAGSTCGYAEGTGTLARFGYFEALAVDSSGNVYVADADNQRIRKITPTGVVTTFAGSGTAGTADGAGTAAQFRYPYGIATDTSGNVYVSDTVNKRIRKITTEGVVSTLAGSAEGYQDGIGMSAKFEQPLGITVDASGAIYVVDGNRIRVIQ